MAGILASVDGDKLVTDKSWKCTTTPQSAGWASSSFDDNSWPFAVIAGTNTASDIHGNLRQVHASASWIWTSNFKGSKIDGTVYCRGYLGEFVELVFRKSSSMCTVRCVCAKKRCAVSACQVNMNEKKIDVSFKSARVPTTTSVVWKVC